MELIQMLLAAIILGIIYKKMRKWEVGATIGKKQALLPIGLGVLSTILAFAVTLAIGYGLTVEGYSLSDIQDPFLKAFVSAFLRAGLTEEFAKLLMILWAICILKPKNVYEYALIGGATGFGFTLLEEMVYGESIMTLFRLTDVAMHMSMGIIMGKYLGLGKYNRENGLLYKSSYVIALAVPVLIHTIYDALTVYNPAIAVEGMDDESMAFWIIMGLIVILCAFVFQIVIIKGMKREAPRLSEMLLTK
ncbi:PrsW family glutamic-type intramembrane protease [Selenomonas sp. FC4001]|uniref:PrsW family glutamic-type intramembrane protease n=1 Tax=Selenomonas sp. FC4001 TaxID=1408313 RepID=UPI00056A1128|nr:PrsW family glutamic-type intramembrane protease [Selenomonas sp. FC4001]